MGSGNDMDSMLEQFEAIAQTSISSAITSQIVSTLMNLAVYILTALALHTIAKRRGINKPWLAWIPFANAWLLGCIADQYRSVARGEVKSRRKVLLGMEIAQTVLMIAVFAVMIKMLIEMMALVPEILLNPESLEMMSEELLEQVLTAIMGPAVVMLLLCLPLLVVAIIYTVFYYIALSDIFKSCDPGNATMYLVLSIVLGIVGSSVLGIPSAAMPAIFLMVCRSRDYGMPPRMEEQPVIAPPQWAPAEPPVEPWEQNRE